MFENLRGAASVMLRIIAEVVAPTRCAACDDYIASNRVFCLVCSVSVLAASSGDAVYEYGGAVATAITRMKYEKRPDLAARFGDVMAKAAVHASAERVDVVVPVPLHPQRLAERGFDQAALLAKPVARALGVRFAPCALTRLRSTRPQASLDRSERTTNVARAFRCIQEEHVRGRAVLLIDDVRTTGATLRACVEALNEGGARSVRIMVLAERA